MRPPTAAILLLFPLFLSGCGGLGETSGEAEMVGNAFGPTGIPPHLRAGGEEGGTAVTPGGNARVDINEVLRSYNPEDLVWTNPDDADAELPEFQSLMEARPAKQVWQQSDTEAVRESKRSGKPLIIWFTDSSGRCPACQTLSNNLLSRSDFEEWASGRVVRLVVDLGVKGRTIEDDTRKKLYVRGVKERYGVRGLPTLMVLAPSGDVIGRYKSYRKGQEDFIWGQLKQGVALADERQAGWKKTMEKKGYRDWSDGKGRVVFAKLIRYHEGELVLVEPDGQKLRTHEKSLSAGDRVWIQQEKEARGR
jgi:thioredoxin-related protein